MLLLVFDEKHMVANKLASFENWHQMGIKKKETSIKQPLKFKVRIVMKGYEHCACMFAPIVRCSTIF